MNFKQFLWCFLVICTPAFAEDEIEIIPLDKNAEVCLQHGREIVGSFVEGHGTVVAGNWNIFTSLLEMAGVHKNEVGRPVLHQILAHIQNDTDPQFAPVRGLFFTDLHQPGEGGITAPDVIFCILSPNCQLKGGVQARVVGVPRFNADPDLPANLKVREFKWPVSKPVHYDQIVFLQSPSLPLLHGANFIQRVVNEYTWYVTFFSRLSTIDVRKSVTQWLLANARRLNQHQQPDVFFKIWGEVDNEGMITVDPDYILVLTEARAAATEVSALNWYINNVLAPGATLRQEQQELRNLYSSFSKKIKENTISFIQKKAGSKDVLKKFGMDEGNIFEKSLEYRNMLERFSQRP